MNARFCIKATISILLLFLCFFGSIQRVNANPDTSTFDAETITYSAEREGPSYPPTTETWGSGQSYFKVGQRWQKEEYPSLLKPNADGSLSEWSQYPNSGSHYQKVDEGESYDSDGTYIYTPTIFKMDMFDCEDVPVDGRTWLDFFVEAHARTGLQQEAQIQIFIYTHNNVYYSVIKDLTTVYVKYTERWENNPFTGETWTSQEINDVEIGVRLFSVGAGDEARVTSLYIRAYYKSCRIYRGFTSFDTSTINDDAIITDVKLSLYLEWDRSITDFNVTVYSGQDQWSGTDDRDWNDCSTSEGVWKDTTGIPINTYYNMSIATSTITKTGKTQFRVISDREGISPIEYEWVEINGWGGTKKPILYVTWTGVKQWYNIVSWLSALNIRQWLIITSWLLTFTAKLWQIIASWLFNAITKAWYDLAIWILNLTVSSWHSLAIWSFTLIVRIWQSITSWLINLTTLGWYNITSWNIQLLIKAWQDIGLGFFNLAVLGWKNITSWMLNLVSLGWHGIVYWVFALSKRSLAMVLIMSIVFLTCLFAILVKQKTHKKEEEITIL